MLIVNERRGRLDAAQTAYALRLLGGLTLAIDTAAEEDTLLRLARRHKLTVYDAAYSNWRCAEVFLWRRSMPRWRGLPGAEGLSMIGEPPT